MTFDEWAKNNGYGNSMLRTHAKAGWDAALEHSGAPSHPFNNICHVCKGSGEVFKLANGNHSSGVYGCDACNGTGKRPSEK